MLVESSAWEAYVEGAEFSWTFEFSPEHMKTFETLSGDHNPLHTDRAFARDKGFDGPVVFGLLLATQVSRLIGQEMPDPNVMLVGFSIDFLKPAFVNQKLTFHAKLITRSQATRLLEFKCSIKHAEKTLCKSVVRGVWRG